MFQLVTIELNLLFINLNLYKLNIFDTPIFITGKNKKKTELNIINFNVNE